MYYNCVFKVTDDNWTIDSKTSDKGNIHVTEYQICIDVRAKIICKLKFNFVTPTSSYQLPTEFEKDRLPNSKSISLQKI